MNPIDLGWAAGIIDGEGTIDCSGSPQNTRWCLIVSANNTDPRMALRLKAIFGVGRLSWELRQKSEKHRPTLRWRVESRKAVPVLEALLPFLQLKREQAEVALAFAATMTKLGTTGLGRRLRPEVVEQRQRLQAQLKVLKRNPPIEEAI